MYHCRGALLTHGRASRFLLNQTAQSKAALMAASAVSNKRFPARYLKAACRSQSGCSLAPPSTLRMCDAESSLPSRVCCIHACASAPPCRRTLPRRRANRGRSFAQHQRGAGVRQTKTHAFSNIPAFHFLLHVAGDRDHAPSGCLDEKRFPSTIACSRSGENFAPL